MPTRNKKILCDQTPSKIPCGSESPSRRTLWLPWPRRRVHASWMLFVGDPVVSVKRNSKKSLTHLELHYASCGSILNFLTDLLVLANPSEKSQLKIEHRIYLHFNKSFVHVTLISELRLAFWDSFQNLANDCQIFTLMIIARRTNRSVWPLFSGQEAHALLAQSKALNYVAMHNAAP